MATIPAITVPITGELVTTTNYRLKCCPCTDNAIINDTDLDQVPPAVTMAPSLQTFNAGGQQLNAPCTIPVCLDCRRLQLGIVSKTGLITA